MLFFLVLCYMWCVMSGVSCVGCDRSYVISAMWYVMCDVLDATCRSTLSNLVSVWWACLNPCGFRAVAIMCSGCTIAWCLCFCFGASEPIASAYPTLLPHSINVCVHGFDDFFFMQAAASNTTYLVQQFVGHSSWRHYEYARSPYKQAVMLLCERSSWLAIHTPCLAEGEHTRWRKVNNKKLRRKVSGGSLAHFCERMMCAADHWLSRAFALVADVVCVFGTFRHGCIARVLYLAHLMCLWFCGLAGVYHGS